MAELGAKAKAALIEARARFVAGLGGRLGEIDRAAAPVLRSAPDADVRKDLTELQGLAHKVAGTAGMFGFHALSEAGRVLETACEAVSAAGGRPTSEERRFIEAAIDALRRTAEQTASERAAGTR